MLTVFTGIWLIFLKYQNYQASFDVLNKIADPGKGFAETKVLLFDGYG